MLHASGIIDLVNSCQENISYNSLNHIRESNKVPKDYNKVNNSAFVNIDSF